MTPERKEHWRWTYAGQIYAALISMPEGICRSDGLRIAVEEADRLIMKLTKSEQKECDHEVFVPLGAEMPVLTECPKCGKKFDIAPSQKVEVRETWDRSGNKTVTCGSCDSVLHETPSQEPCEHEWDSDIGACRKCGMDVFDERA